ncbi:uncharacterized protein LOC129906792 [Episyrphus balteatus]|uniref:uncharacterized protein LOC129906792 n=1 Tax=Episyrphus balteatus TaxID=286459 RepID=UPI002486434E|nr:uncharacterized protein LOC129906792 [Episyrphus balteatus]
MVPEYAEFVVIHMIYGSTREKPLMMTRRRDKPSSSLSQVKDWYRRTFTKEVNALNQTDWPIRLSIREWRIFSGDKNLFTLDNLLFEQIFIILGVDAWHWIFFKKDRGHVRLEGSAVIPFSYCGCCVFNQYPRILDAIKASRKKKSLTVEGILQCS